MNNDDRLQIFTNYLDGSIQGYGYDGQWFDTHETMLADVLKDFAEPKNLVVGMRYVWGTAEKQKELSPLYGQDLIDDLTAWLTEIGVYNGN